MSATKEMIIETYKKLVIQNHTTKIKVSNICNEMQISRTTFYNYFSDVNAITEEIIVEDALEPMKRLISVDLNAENITYNFYLNFLKNKEFYLVAILDDGQNSLFDTIIERMSKINLEIYRDVLTGRYEEDDLEYIAYKYAAMQAMLLKKWMKEGMKVPCEKMMEYFLHNLQT